MSGRGLAAPIKVDLRSVALFRVALAGITIADLSARLCEAGAFYADAGVLPRRALIDLADPSVTSLHLASGTTAGMVAAITTQLLLAALVLFGVRARLGALASFVLLASLNARNPWVTLPGDALTVTLWFWAMFLPLGARWSPAAALSPATTDECASPSWGALGLLLHLSLLTGVAVAVGGPLAPAPLVVGLLVLLPASFWQGMSRLLDHGRRLRIHYDRDCAACRTCCELLVHFLGLPRTEVAPAQDQARIRALMESRNSWVVVDADDVAHTKWRGFVAVLRHSPPLRWLGPVAGLSIWERPGNALYDFIARHRHLLAIVTPSSPPRPMAVPGRGTQHLALVMAILLLPWTLARFDVLPEWGARPVSALFAALGMDPAREIAPRATALRPAGRTADGRDVNVLMRDAPLFEGEPAQSSRRWRAWQAQLSREGHGAQRGLYSAYLCRHWNSGSEAPLESIRLIDLVPSGDVSQPPAYEQQVLWRDYCRS